MNENYYNAKDLAKFGYIKTTEKLLLVSTAMDAQQVRGQAVALQ
ncbi:MAG TPA: hypothetical protein VM368_06915 [Flavisolibacter sp.]|nr:hypothetical protein [Flavisolibacter sp.]